MMIRTVLSCFASIVALAGAPAMADPVPLKDLSTYINALTSAQTTFTQYNADGSRSSGTLQIQRPGRMRFEYAAPNEALVLANAGVVAIFDAKSNAEPQQFPLRRTPLNLILGKNVDLTDTNMVYAHTENEQGYTVVSARNAQSPESGSIDLYFTADPVALAQWVITDEAGNKTGVDLGVLDQSVSFPSNFFSVNREMNRRK